jgi:aldose 1-epimerase
MEKQLISGLKRKDFQAIVQGKETDLYTLTNENGMEVSITNYGGAVVSIMVPDRNGNMANVIQGHDSIKGVVESPEPFLSTLIGRYGNRICKGKFTMNGKEYSLAINNGPNSLHGGPTGCHARVWDAEQVNDQELVLRYVFAYYEEGFPGEVHMTVKYSLTDDNELVIDYRGTTNKKTIINMTHHAFFSLTGIGNPTPDQLDCLLQVNADFYIPIDETSIPTGEILKVEGTPFDFRTEKTIGQDIEADDEQIKNGSGYDHCYVLNKKEPGELSWACTMTDPKSGRTLETWTTEPGMQFYSGNFLSGISIQNGCTAPRRSAMCFEAQHFPDSPNRPYFPSVQIRPGEVYKQKTVYKFGLAD